MFRRFFSHEFYVENLVIVIAVLVVIGIAVLALAFAAWVQGTNEKLDRTLAICNAQNAQTQKLRNVVQALLLNQPNLDPVVTSILNDQLNNELRPIRCAT